MGDQKQPLTMNQKVVVWARGALGKKIGEGECWDLAEEALKKAEAKTSNDLGPVGENTDYIWGELKNIKDVEPGDILQLRDWVVTIKTVEEPHFENIKWDELPFKSRERKRGHHTAIVRTKMDPKGVIHTIEQKVQPRGKIVQKKKLFTRNVPPVVRKVMEKRKHPDTKKFVTVKVTKTVTITVSGNGTIWAYKPIPKPK